MKTFKFHTLGCKVNQYDTQQMRERLLERGMQEASQQKLADIYLINTCTVTGRADSESLNILRRVRRENPKARILVTGCLTELDRDRIMETDKQAIVVTNKEKVKLTEILSDLGEIGHLAGNSLEKISSKGISRFYGHTRAFLKIQDGCNNFCAYCKVPLVRGASISKPLQMIVEEAERLAQNGFKELVLTGICLGSYGKELKPAISLVEVIDSIEKIEGILRIRLSSIEAGDVTGRLIDKMNSSKKLCPHLHIPIQSGDDKILKMMKRRYTSRDYLQLIRRIRLKIPQVAITTDVLVGFPGEGEDNFKNTLDLVKKIRPLKVHIFPYSRREGTCAAEALKDQVDFQIVKRRIFELGEQTKALSLAFKKGFLNKKLDVLVESKVKDDPRYWQGYTGNYIGVKIRSKRPLGNKLIILKRKRLSSLVI